MNTTPQLPKSILVTHVYSSDNKGDAALTSVLLQDIARKFPDAKVTILTLDAKEKSFEGVPQQPAFMYAALNKYQNIFMKLAYVIYMVPATLLWAWWYKLTKRALPLPPELRTVAMLYADADMVVAVGGGYLRSRKGLANRLNVPLLLHPLLFGHVLGLPTVLYSQSVGPFVHWYEGLLVRMVLSRLDLIMLREDTSMALLEKLGVVWNVVRAIDSGFLLRGQGHANLRKKYGIPKDLLLVGVTVRSWLKGKAQDAYEHAVAAALDATVVDYEAHILFIPQVTAGKGDDDREASMRVHKAMHFPQSATVVMDTPDHHHIKAMYNELDVLLGTRFHSVIFSLTSFVPVAAIEYEYKTSGIMRDLHLLDWVIKIEDVNAVNLAQLMQKLVRQRDGYRNQLKQVVPPYVRQAERAADLLVDSYTAAQVSKKLSDNGVVEV